MLLYSTPNKHNRAKTRILSLVLASALTFSLTGRVMAEASNESAVPAANVNPSCDEAYYATLDYYGALKEGGVVKSYELRGAKSIEDFGSYDEVINLSDDTQPAVTDGHVTFDFKDAAPDRFYFEGKGSKPFDEMPWTLNLTYRLNGVPTKAEDLAGTQGLIEINIDAVPKEEVCDYYKNNCVLQAVAAFNADDILSLEAPGAQVQLIGNMKVVLFFAMPGETEHFTIRVGSDDFSFSGVTFLIVPATLSQLSQIADLRDAKDEVEDSYDAISDSLDVILNTLDGMKGSLDSTADGLSQLNQARASVSSGKGAVYDGADTALTDLTALADSLAPLAEHLNTASQALTETTDLLTKLTDNAVALKALLKDTRETIDDIQDNTSDLYNLLQDIDDIELSPYTISNNLKIDLGHLNDNLSTLQTRLSSMRSLLNTLSGGSVSTIDEITIGGYTVDELTAALEAAEAQHSAYEAYLGENGLTEDDLSFLTYLGGSESPYASLAAIYDERDAIKQAQSIDSLLDQVNDIDQVNDSISELNDTSAALASSTASLLSALEKTCGSLDGDAIGGDLQNLASLLAQLSGLLEDYDVNTLASDLLDDADNIGSTVRAVTKNADTALDLLDQLDDTVNKYVPDATQALTEAQAASNAAVSSIQSVTAFLRSLETLLEKSGGDLDAGTQKTLAGLSDTLKKSAGGLAQTGTIRGAKDAITTLIEDEWDSHTGEDNRILLMDPSAAPVSITSEKNASPASIQYILRSEEIKVEKADNNSKADEESGETGTFFSRVADMFKAFWDAIAHLFS